MQDAIVQLKALAVHVLHRAFQTLFLYLERVYAPLVILALYHLQGLLIAIPFRRRNHQVNLQDNQHLNLHLVRQVDQVCHLPRIRAGSRQVTLVGNHHHGPVNNQR